MWQSLTSSENAALSLCHSAEGHSKTCEGKHVRVEVLREALEWARVLLLGAGLSAVVIAEDW